MSLRKQLLFFGLLTLVLPWAGYRYVQEMEDVLRSGLERTLLERASTVGTALERQALLADSARDLAAAGTPIYAPLLAAEPRIDGSRDDWSLGADFGTTLADGSRFWSGVYERFAYFAIEVPDASIVYQRRPGEAPYGDRILVVLRNDGSARWLVLSTAAPGVVRAQQTTPPLFIPNAVFDDRVRAAWRETAGAYSVEFRLPLGLASAGVGVAIIDVDRRDADFDVSMQTSWGDATTAPGRLITARNDVQEAVAQFVRPGDRYRVVDHDGWVVATSGSVGSGPRASLASGSILEALLRRILRREDPSYDTGERPAGRIADPGLRAALAGDPAVAWYRGGAEQEAVVVAAVPLRASGEVTGALVLEQASDAILTATDQALVRLMAVTLGAALVVMLGMLTFATILSYRVGRLAKAAEHALGPKGEIRPRLPGTRAADEIGALARSFADLLERLRNYTGYLRTLTSKLSHELRTPLAVVSTSLDNLETEEQRSSPYLVRLRQGVNRLDAILVAMSEATHIEQAIEDTEVERFDLEAVVATSAHAYADVYSDREIAFEGLGREAPIEGSPDLVSQLLDKLVDNAVSFSAPGSRVRIALAAADSGGYRLAVENRGPLLPEAMRAQLFDSLVSLRAEKGDKPHLGLGLYVAALIARFHRASIDATNLDDGSGVCVSVVFPKRRD